MELHILKSLNNYFIMHDIKYVFLNQNNQPIQGAKKIWKGGGKLPKALPKKTIFQNPEGQLPPGSLWIRPCSQLPCETFGSA
jgi:hypothetical protein